MGCAVSAPPAHVSAPMPGPPSSEPSAPKGMGVLAIKVPPGGKAGQLIQARTPQGQLVQCQIPAGVPPGGIFRIQYPLQTLERRGSKIMEVEVVDEEAQMDITASAEAIQFPQYWTNVQYPNNTSFDQMIYVASDRHPKFDELLAASYVAKATQDRSCPKRTCPRTPGGCPCVQVDGNPGLPTGYRVRRVIRVEDSEMWGRYVEKREKLQSTRAGSISRIEPDVKTDEIADTYKDVFDPLDADLNEVYLWHGTNVRRALSIAQDDFKIDLAGTSRGTMYGAGAYLAESSTKADEYATDEPGGYYEGVFALLLCRVLLGKFLYTTQRDEEAGNKVRAGGFDSTLGDRVKSVGTFREFVVYDADQIYPEYVVLYTRVPKDQDPLVVASELASSPFHMQLPVYWSNCHKDPFTDPFNAQFKVRSSTRAILQRFLDSSYFVDGRKIQLVGARRIENSVVWNKYVEHKQLLKQSLNTSRKSVGHGGSTGSLNAGFVRANELDGDFESGHVLTHVALGNEAIEESISVSNLEEQLNEFLLWHGTSKRAAEIISKEDFRIPKRDNVDAGFRFGHGAYFAEHLGKSLSYAKPEDSGLQYILLCRVLCGDIYYTEAVNEIDAGDKCAQQGKHSVLAHPGKKEDREFIVQNESQVYPEYLLELRVTSADGSALQPRQLAPSTQRKVPPPGMRHINCGATSCGKMFAAPVHASAVSCPHCGAINQVAT